MYSQDPIDQARATSFLDKVRLPKLSSTQFYVLNAPITMEYFTFTIKHLANKALGPVEYTAEFFKLTQDYILDTFLQVYKAM